LTYVGSKKKKRSDLPRAVKPLVNKYADDIVGSVKRNGCDKASAMKNDENEWWRINLNVYLVPVRWQATEKSTFKHVEHNSVFLHAIFREWFDRLKQRQRFVPRSFMVIYDDCWLPQGGSSPKTTDGARLISMYNRPFYLWYTNIISYDQCPAKRWT